MPAEMITKPVWQIFTPEQIDLSTVEKEWVEYREINVTNLESLTKLEIETRDKDSFILPHEGYLEVRFKITQDAAGTVLAGPENVTIQNNALSLFRNIEYLIEDQRIEYLDEPGLAFTMKNISDFSKQYGESIASNQMFYLDSSDEPLISITSNQVRFFNTNAARVGVEIFFTQDANFKWVPTVAAAANIWQANDVIQPYLGYYGGQPVNFYSYTAGAANYNTRTLRQATLDAAGILTLAGTAANDVVVLGPPGSKFIIQSSGAAVTALTINAGTAQPVTTPNAAGALIDAYSLIPSEQIKNNGFNSRVNRTGAGRDTSVWIPFKDMFLFCRAYDKISRGLRHRIVINKQSDMQAL